MKKLFLLLSAGLVGLGANAQQNQSIMLPHSLSAETVKSHAHLSTLPVTQLKQHADAKVTGSGSTGAWFDYWNQLDGGSGSLYYFDVYQDSTVLDVSGTTPSNIFVHGLGESFDPTDSAFSYNYYNGSAGFVPINFMVTQNNAFDVDSVYLIGKYMMNNPNYVDTLIMDLVVTGVSQTDGTFLLHFPAGTPEGDAITADGTPRFGDAIYKGSDPGLPPVIYNQMAFDSITATTQRYTMVLDTTAYADTDQSSGLSVFQFAMTPAIHVPAGAKVLAFAHFKSGHTYPFNTPTTTANYLQLFAGQPLSSGQFPPQSASNSSTGYNGSFQSGLISSNQNLYNDTGYAYLGHNMLVPSVAYQQSPGFDAPRMGFYVTCTSCYDLAVNDVKNTVSNVSAYPSPANDNLNISFTLGNSADVTVSLTNEIGQVVRTQDLGSVQHGVATLNTSNLSSGLYFYTVNAGGQRSTGKVLIAH